MGWAVGGPDDYGRWYGYGVPATCDQPGCGKDIDRGLAHACGDGVMGENNCGLYFCGGHLNHFREDDDRGGQFICERCATDADPFEPTPDKTEWLTHLLTDESWQKWRDEEPRAVENVRAELDRRQS